MSQDTLLENSFKPLVLVASPKIVSPPIFWGELDDFSNFERGGGGKGGGDFRKLGGANLK